MLALATVIAATLHADDTDLRGTGDLGIVIERATGSLLIIDTTTRTTVNRVEGLGDLSHASAVFSRDARYAFVFGRDGGLTKVDLLTGTIVGRVVQAGNAIGGAISDDGTLVAVSNYEPGGVRVFDARRWHPSPIFPRNGLADSRKQSVLSMRRVASSSSRCGMPAKHGSRIFPKVGNLRSPSSPASADNPYDALITADGRHYIAGLYGEDGLALIDLWEETLQPRRILNGYGRGEEKLPVYKMPHLEGLGARR